MTEKTTVSNLDFQFILSSIQGTSWTLLSSVSASFYWEYNIKYTDFL